MPGDGSCPDLHVSAAAPDLLQLPAAGDLMSGVQGGLPGAAQGTQVRGERRRGAEEDAGGAGYDDLLNFPIHTIMP